MWQQRGLLDPDRIFFDLKPIEYWMSRFRAVIRSIPPDDGGDLHAICAFQLLLAEILASVESKPSEDETRWLERAQAALESVERVDLLDMEGIADRLNMSYVNFRKKFTRLARTSPGKYHSALLMQHACRILMEQKITDRELSQRLGYSDPYYFAQRFQRTIGMTPRQFRKSLLGTSKPR
jgi:AraC-like DNA-binding protein